MLKRFLKGYFTFTRSERNGIIILLSLLCLLIAARTAFPFLLNDKITDFEAFDNELALFESSLQIPEESGISETTGSPFKPFFFDPNKVSEADLLMLGLDRFVTGNILKYREKGGWFSSARDLKKIYGLKDEVYIILEPFILIESELIDSEKQNQGKQDGNYAEIADSMNRLLPEGFVSDGATLDNGNFYSPAGLLIPLNQADSSQLIRLPGIGPVLSGRIIRYRELLGGYISKEQLLEVYQITPERFDRISGLVCIDTQNINLMDVNHVMADSLPYHPYISDYYLRAIIKFRDLNGSFERIGEIPENRLLPPEVYQKVQPYLTVGEVRSTRY